MEDRNKYSDMYLKVKEHVLDIYKKHHYPNLTVKELQYRIERLLSTPVKDNFSRILLPYILHSVPIDDFIKEYDAPEQYLYTDIVYYFKVNLLHAIITCMYFNHYYLMDGSFASDEWERAITSIRQQITSPLVKDILGIWLDYGVSDVDAVLLNNIMYHHIQSLQKEEDNE